VPRSRRYTAPQAEKPQVPTVQQAGGILPWLDNHPHLLLPEEVAQILGVAKREVLEHPTLPRLKLGPQTVRYAPRDVAALLTGSRYEPRGQSAAFLSGMLGNARSLTTSDIRSLLRSHRSVSAVPRDPDGLMVWLQQRFDGGAE
jgi:hypothetical protein